MFITGQIKRGLRTTDPDYGPGIQRGLGIKRGLRTGYKISVGPGIKRGLNTKHCEKGAEQRNSNRLTT